MGPTFHGNFSGAGAGVAAGAAAAGAGVEESGVGVGVCAPATSANVNAAPVIAVPAMDRIVTLVFDCIDMNPPEKSCDVRKTQRDRSSATARARLSPVQGPFEVAGRLHPVAVVTACRLSTVSGTAATVVRVKRTDTSNAKKA